MAISIMRGRGWCAVPLPPKYLRPPMMKPLDLGVESVPPQCTKPTRAVNSAEKRKDKIWTPSASHQDMTKSGHHVSLTKDNFVGAMSQLTNIPTTTFDKEETRICRAAQQCTACGNFAQFTHVHVTMRALCARITQVSSFAPILCTNLLYRKSVPGRATPHTRCRRSVPRHKTEAPTSGTEGHANRRLTG